MKLLLDACVWGGTADQLATSWEDVVWAGDWTEDPGDEEILARAHHEGRVFVTLDKDFGELIIVRGQRHAGIVRLVDIGARQQAAVCLQVLTEHGEELQAGAIVTVEPGRIRVRPPVSE